MGFPTLKDIKPAFKEEYEKVIASDANELKKLVFDASESIFSRQLGERNLLERLLRECWEMIRQRYYRNECVLF